MHLHLTYAFVNIYSKGRTGFHTILRFSFVLLWNRPFRDFPSSIYPEWTGTEIIKVLDI